MRPFTVLFSLIMVSTAFCQSPKLRQAIRSHESGGNRHAFNRKENAAGDMQIRPGVVKDCNKILGKKKFNLRDRFNPRHSAAMFELYIKHYGRLYHKQTGCAPTDETYARIWNGGPQGWRKPTTYRYWVNVRSRY